MKCRWITSPIVFVSHNAAIFFWTLDSINFSHRHSAAIVLVSSVVALQIGFPNSVPFGDDRTHCCRTHGIEYTGFVVVGVRCSVFLAMENSSITERRQYVYPTDEHLRADNATNLSWDRIRNDPKPKSCFYASLIWTFNQRNLVVLWSADSQGD